MGMHFRDHHEMIKSIEECSLQATFDPEISSTKELLLQEYEDSSFVTLKASHDSYIHPVEQRGDFNKTPFLSAKPSINMSLLPIDSINKDDHVPSDRTTNDGSTPLVLTHQNGNIPSNRITNYSNMPTISTSVHGNMSAVVVGEDGEIPYQQSNFLGRLPREVWGQKIEELRQWTGTKRVYRDIHDLSYSNHKHPNHDRLWDSKNLFCMGCTKDTIKICESCGDYCCLWSLCKKRADTPKSGILPQERVKATQWLKRIACLMSYGIDEPTFLACSRCGKVVCPECIAICELCDALVCCPDCCGKCPICQIPKCVRCKPNWEDECSYHKGPPAI